MAYTQADLDGIRAAIASGVLETRFADGRMVRYQTTEAMMGAEQRIAGVIAGASPGARPARRVARYRNGC